MRWKHPKEQGIDTMANTVTKANGDVLLANTIPHAEYMYGCTATSMGMLLGYYDLYGYNGIKMTNLIAGTVELESRGTDGNAYDMDAFDTVLGKAIASEGYVYRFYSRDGVATTPEQELPYTFKGDTTELNTDEWDCIADYLGTGQYWRGNSNLSTIETYCTLEHLCEVPQSVTITTGSITRTVPYRNISMLYGLDLYVQSRGYSLDPKNTGTFEVDVHGGSFTFEQYMAEINAGRPVIVSIEGHAMIGYGYNESTQEIIFDDCYSSDQRMTWGGGYYYSGANRALESITTVVFNVEDSIPEPTTPTRTYVNSEWADLSDGTTVTNRVEIAPVGPETRKTLHGCLRRHHRLRCLLGSGSSHRGCYGRRVHRDRRRRDILR